ncbi:hypothetical protein Pelo_19006 [Pelomyxa schiedti]|nr:hypothetical protein Pelo_19006 [Pelomyxa schiedti]
MSRRGSRGVSPLTGVLSVVSLVLSLVLPEEAGEFTSPSLVPDYGIFAVVAIYKQPKAESTTGRNTILQRVFVVGLLGNATYGKFTLFSSVTTLLGGLHTRHTYTMIQFTGTFIRLHPSTWFVGAHN